MFAMIQKIFEKNTPNTTPNKPEEEKIEIVKDDKINEKKGTEKDPKDDSSSILDNTSLPSLPIT